MKKGAYDKTVEIFESGSKNGQMSELFMSQFDSGGTAKLGIVAKTDILVNTHKETFDQVKVVCAANYQYF